MILLGRVVSNLNESIISLDNEIHTLLVMTQNVSLHNHNLFQGTIEMGEFL